MAYLGVYRALYDYAPQSAEELAITEGDLLFVLEKSEEDDWWKCRKKAADDEEDEPEGLVPNNYIEEAAPTHSAKALYDYTKQTDEELSFKEDARLDVFDESDPDWTLVGCNGQYGFAPAIYIEAIKAAAPSARAVTSAPPPTPPRPTTADEPIPGEADYVPPSPASAAAANSPAAALAGIITQKTGGASSEPAARSRALATPPPSVPQAQYTPEESEEEEEPPPKPARPQSQASVASQQPQSPPPARSMPSPPRSPRPADKRKSSSPYQYHLYNIHEMIEYQGKPKKLPMTLGINVPKGTIMIAPEKSRDGESQEWTAEKLTHYSIEGKHVFIELVRPSKSVDFHAGAKDTAHDIVAHLGELAGAARAEGLKEVLAASKGSGADGIKTGQMLYEFMAQGDDEVTVAVGDEVHILDDLSSEEWWMVKRLKNGKEGVVPSSYVEITGMIYPPASSTKNFVEQNRLEEERLTKEATKKKKGKDSDIPERDSSLATGSRGRGKRGSNSGGSKSYPKSERVRTWTDRSGTFKVDAEFIGLRDGKIHLHKVNGIKIAVPVAKMSVEDLEYVEKATGTSLDDDKPLSDIKRRTTQKTNGNVGASIDRENREKRVKDEDFWFDFFLSCGIDHQVVGRYVNSFLKDQMTEEILPQVNEPLLRTLGFKEGDILRVMKALDTKLGRTRNVEGANGETGLFSGPGGALRNNTKKSRPAPAVQTNDLVSEEAFRSRSVSPGPSTPTGLEGAKATPLASAPAREPKTGFDDDAWDVKPARTRTPEIAVSRAVEAPKTAAPPKPLINDDIASLSITSPPLEPTRAPPPSAAPAQTSPEPAATSQTQPSQPQGADKAIFDKIAALAPGRQRPQPPPPINPQLAGGALAPPPQRASSAPGFPPQQQQQSGFAPPPLQAQLTGYANPQNTGYQQQQPQQLQPQPTAFQYGGYQGQQQNGFIPQQQPQATGIQAVQQNYPALQPQPTGLNFQPQSQFGQQQQNQQYGIPQPPQGFTHQQQLVNGAQTGSPFADPPRQPYQPGAPSGLQNSFIPQPTGYQPQPTFNFQQPQQTAINGFGPPQQQQAIPQLPPQQTGGVFGPSQPAGLNAPPAPLIAQKTGPAPPVRFGVQPGQNKLVPQPTGRANLSKATPQNPFGF